MQTVRVTGNTIACSCIDVSNKSARFGIFVGNANSLGTEDNCIALGAAGVSSVRPADAVRVVGYIGPKGVVRGNYVTGFAMGTRVVVLTGNGPGTPAANDGGTDDDTNLIEYLRPLRSGSQWLVADNVIKGASTSPPLGRSGKTKANSTTSPATPVPTVPSYVQAQASLLVNNAGGGGRVAVPHRLRPGQ